MVGRAPARRRDWSWRSQAFRGLIYQVLTVTLLGVGVWYLSRDPLV